MKKVHSALIGSGIAAAALIIMIGVASAQTAAFTSEFGVGAQGANVISLQTWLTEKGYYSGPVTGYYGPLTMAGVESFQAANGISATGYVGPLTLAALNSVNSNQQASGTNTSLLVQLQAQLSSLLAQIQAIESQTTTVPSGASMTLQTNQNVSTGAALSASGNGPFTYSLSANPLNGMITSFNSATGAFTYTPNNNYTGSDTFSYTVRNAVGVSAPMTITVNVGSSSGAANGQALSFSTYNGAAYTGTLSGSGSTPLTFSIVSSPSHGTISGFNSSTGAFTYTPSNASYNGSDTFTYTVSNSSGASTAQTVTINQQPTANSGAPTGQSFSFSTNENSSYNGTLSGSGSGSLTYAIVTPPAHGTINSFTPATGAFSYTPSNGYSGSDSFTYTVANSSGTSGIYTVNITD